MSERWLGDPGDKPWPASEWSGLRLGWEPVDGIFFSNATPGKVGGGSKCELCTFMDGEEAKEMDRLVLSEYAE